MNEIELNDPEVGSLEAVRQAARDFAAALAATPQFLAFEATGGKLDEDADALESIRAFRAKQEELKMMQTLKAVSAEDREEFDRLWRTMQNQPSIAAYLQAQAALVSICQAAGDLLSEQTGINFATSACSSGCCG